MKKPKRDTPLSRIRTQRKFTQRELADVCGIHQGQISRVESGARGLSVPLAKRLATALKCQWPELLGEDVIILSSQEKFLINIHRDLSPLHQQMLERIAGVMARTAHAHGG